MSNDAHRRFELGYTDERKREFFALRLERALMEQLRAKAREQEQDLSACAREILRGGV